MGDKWHSRNEPANSSGDASWPVEAPVRMMPSARKNSAALAISPMLKSAVTAWELINKNNAIK
jgi:hypothetical protein